MFDTLQGFKHQMVSLSINALSVKAENVTTTRYSPQLKVRAVGVEPTSSQLPYYSGSLIRRGGYARKTLAF